MYDVIQSKINKKKKSYLMGFLFSIILTTLSFFVIIEKIFSSEINFFIILLSAIIQIVIHFVYFLHIDFSNEGKWRLVTLLFVIVIIFIVLFGSIWIMSHLNHHVIN